MGEKTHAKKCGTNKHKYYGDQRNLPWGNEMHDCNCDGYHTWDELYEHRITLYLALCRQYADRNGNEEGEVWRSELHHDGTRFDGWFVLGLFTEKGRQITYHLPMSRWENAYFAKTVPRAPEFDGHTPDDVLERLKNL